MAFGLPIFVTYRMPFWQAQGLPYVLSKPDV